jgi:hypothetical protein
MMHLARQLVFLANFALTCTGNTKQSNSPILRDNGAKLLVNLQLSLFSVIHLIYLSHV